MIYFVTGMPLSGKSTVARRLAAEARAEYLGTGEYARSLGMGLEPSIKTRDLSEAFNDRINARVFELVESSGGHCVVDGYPRSLEQLNKVRTALDGLRSYRVIYVTVNPLVVYDRLERRARAEGRPEDTVEVVCGRLDRARAWRVELATAYPAVEFFRADDGGRVVP